MDRVFPPLMKAIMHEPGIKQAWVSDFPHVLPGECYNCAGSGFLTLQIALSGPYHSPSMDKVLSSKSDIINGKLMWWGVKTQTFCCPVCGGIGRNKTPAQDEGRISNRDIIDTAKKLEHWQTRADMAD